MFKLRGALDPTILVVAMMVLVALSPFFIPQALRWQRLPAFAKVAQLLSRHLDGILAYCHVKVPFGKVEAINGNIRAMIRRGRGYRDHEYLLLKVQKATAERRRARRAA